MRRSLELLLSVESAKELISPDELAVQITGVCEPDDRIKKVSLSLFSSEMELPKRDQIEISRLEVIDRLFNRAYRYDDVSRRLPNRVLGQRQRWI